MARIYSLYSSSQGNAVFVGTERGGILIDIGVSCRSLISGLAACGIPAEAVQGIFITHVHSDHVKGLRVFTARTGCTVYGQGKTLRHLIDSDHISPVSRVVEVKSKTAAAGMEITPFNTPHDTEQSCGYRIQTADGKLCAVCTDLGHITQDVITGLKGCRMVMLESNYDENMLRTGNYPMYIKKRILSKNGHLSNHDCTAGLARLIESGTTHFLLGHLSQENNKPMLADKTAETGLAGYIRGRDYLLSIAPVKTCGAAVIF